MNYFVTGATGFIGRRLVEKLLARGGTVYFLAYRPSAEQLAGLYERWGVDDTRAIPLEGDITAEHFGLDEQTRAQLEGRIDHMFHLAAVYDLMADAASQEAANIEGTRNAVAFAEAIEAGCFHLVSSIVAAGTYNGVFREDMFEEAEGLTHPYFRTKHDSEALVREHCSVPWCVYRPGIVVGDSRTGEMDKIDGPYYFFKAIQRTRGMLPKWMPTVGIEGGVLSIVPVDYVVAAMDHIAHLDQRESQCYHLVDPRARRIGEVLNIFARAAHAPEMALRINASMFGFLPPYVLKGLQALRPVRRMSDSLLSSFGIPRETLQFINMPTRYDDRETQKALAGSGIELPALEDYAWRLWDYWERHLDPDLYVDRSLSGRVRDRVVLITGASSGIGKAAALRIGEAGGRVILVARTREKLEDTQREIDEAGGRSFIYPCDISDHEACDRMVRQVLADHGAIDVLVNNAGRSIRRGIENSFDRFHDFERTMQLNYFGALRLTLNTLPAMIERGSGHVINISSIGVLSNAPRFSAYVASKAAMDAFTRCAASEMSHRGVHFTTINMPLVRTPMIAPTKLYENVPTISAEEAAELIAQAIISRPKRVATRLGIFAEIAHLLAPRITELGMNEAFQLFPDSPAARSGKDKADAPTAEQIALAQFTRGIHW